MLKLQLQEYLHSCQFQKRLDTKTIKAYRIDLNQFINESHAQKSTDLNQHTLEKYIEYLNQTYKPKTVKRKIASLKAFCHYLYYRDYINQDPFAKMQLKFREPITLPKIIPLHTIEVLLQTMYHDCKFAKTDYQRKNAARDVAVIELLFATGMRISELCSLEKQDVNLMDQVILIHGKGSKERRIHIGNADVINTLNTYIATFQSVPKRCTSFFITQKGYPFSDQAIRKMIKKYSDSAGIDLHITPHMFRHTFATSLLEADVDIRYIQEMLGHSSINITEIYTHVATAKQRDILVNKHPRRNFRL